MHTNACRESTLRKNLFEAERTIFERKRRWRYSIICNSNRFFVY